MSVHRELLVVAIALAAGCSGLEPLAEPHNVTDARPTTINPKHNLTYVDDGGTVVYIYDFLNRVGHLTDFNNVDALCVDSKQDIYALDRGLNEIYEYAHASTKRIKTLTESAGSLFDCASDPTTGNLAVTNDVSGDDGSQPGNVLIYPNGSGTPKEYVIGNALYDHYVAYDAAGNLFVDGLKYDGSGYLAELTKGAQSFKTLTMNVKINPGCEQWDGRYLAIDDQGIDPQVIDRFAISGSQATKKASTILKGDVFAASFFIATYSSGDILYATNQTDFDVGLWLYPKGGAAGLTIGPFVNPLSVVLSKATK